MIAITERNTFLQPRSVSTYAPINLLSFSCIGHSMLDTHLVRCFIHCLHNTLKVSIHISILQGYRGGAEACKARSLVQGCTASGGWSLDYNTGLLEPNTFTHLPESHICNFL